MLGADEGGQALVEGEADGLDGDVGAVLALEERAEDAGGHVATAADGDHEVGLDVFEDAGSRFLAEFVDLERSVRKGIGWEVSSGGGRKLHRYRLQRASRPFCQCFVSPSANRIWCNV